MTAGLHPSVDREDWATGVTHELRFWEHWLRTGGAEWAGEFKRRFDPNSELLVDPRYVILPTEGELHILDVGAGPITSVGKRRPGVDVHVTAVDPLADEYNELLDSLGMEPPVRTLKGEAESLVPLFGSERFDLVMCSNALDHSHDPLRGLEQMLEVGKIDGDLLLYHQANEGERERYEGFHGWNFAVEYGRFLIWRPGARIFPDEHLAPVARMFTGPDIENWIVLAIRKSSTRPVPADGSQWKR